MSHGRVRQFTWTHDGQKRRAWGFTVTIDGKRSRRQGYGSRAEAQEALDALKHPAPATEPTVPTMTLAEAFERYFKAKARKRSIGEDERIAKHLKAEFGEKTALIEITASCISLYQEKLLAIEKSRRGGALSAASMNRPLALLRSLLRMACRKWEVLTAPPIIELEKEPQGRLRWLTHEEAIRLLDACREQRNAALVDLVELALYTGMRQGELLGLTWGSVDRSRGVVLLEETKGAVSGANCHSAGLPTLSWPGVRVTGRPRGWSSALRAGTPSGSTGSGLSGPRSSTPLSGFMMCAPHLRFMGDAGGRHAP